jgi:cytochrome P450
MVDLADPGLYGDGDPHWIWQAMRDRDPVRWQPLGGTGFWSVTTHADANQVLRDARTFTSERGTLLSLLGVNDPAGGCQMAVTDPPRHTAMRSPLQRAMTGASLERHTGTVRAEVRRLLEPALDGAEMDFAAATMALSTGVAGTLMGLSPDDWPYLTRLMTMAIAPDDPDFQLPGGSRATLERSHRELFGYLQDVARSRQRTPGDDLISLFFQIRVDDAPLSAGAVASNCYSLLLGASVTTPHVPSATLLELIDGGGYEEWAAHPEHLSSGIEEALRWSTPASHFLRYATRDVEVGGKTIRSGEAVVVWLGSANRDASVFSDPFRFDVRRTPNRHIAFGVGPHHCVGHAAARLTLHLLFGEIFRRFEGWELAGSVRHLRSNFIAGIARLPVRAHLRPAVLPAWAELAPAGCPA